MSGYKKFHTQNYMICVDGLGFVIYTAGPVEGMANDRAALNTTPFVEFPCPMLSEGEIILTDGGFAGDGEILHQFTPNELARLTADERQNAASWTEDFGYNRTLIEHCIHRIKTRTQALAHRWQRDVSRQSELFSLAASCRLYNRLRRLRLEYAWSSRHASLHEVLQSRWNWNTQTHSNTEMRLTCFLPPTTQFRCMLHAAHGLIATCCFAFSLSPRTHRRAASLSDAIGQLSSSIQKGCSQRLTWSYIIYLLAAH